MFSPGIIVIFFLIATLTFFALCGIRVVGWGGVVLGACGLAYSVVVYPEYIVLAVFPLSVLLLVIGFVAVAIRGFRNRA